MSRHRRPLQKALLRTRLDELVATFDASTLTPDPLELVLRYSDRRDQEVAGLIAAAFAYGRAATVVHNIGAVLEGMGPSPARYLETFDRDESAKQFAGFVHRFQKTPELLALLERMGAVLRHYGSLGELFRLCHDPADADIGPSLTRFVAAVIGIVPPQVTERPALEYLLTSPANGSACKRMNLYLRWMVRREPPDLGLWTFVAPSQLLIPLDTHVHRISNFLGITGRRAADWKTAREITDNLGALNAADPVRYDFAICRLGILDQCSRRRRKENCDRCLLRDVCRFPVM